MAELKVGSNVAHMQTGKVYRVVGFGFADTYIGAGLNVNGGMIVVLRTDDGEERFPWLYMLDPNDDRSVYEILS